MRAHKFEEEDIQKLERKMIINNSVSNIEQIARGERKLAEQGAFTPLTQVVPLLKTLNNGKKEVLEDFINNLNDPTK